jgi:thiol-disulfide isomerase/thioredoxin
MYKLLKPNARMGIGESPAFDDHIISFSKNDGVCVTICNYEVPDTSCGFIFEMFGQENFIVPGDTMNVFVTPLTKDSAKALEKVYWPIGKRRLTFSGPNKYVYELFDSLQFFIGRDMRFIQLVPAATDVRSKNYYDLVTEKFTSRVEFLNGYCKRHDVPDRFKKLAFSEINCLYKSNLLVPIGVDTNKGNMSSRYPDYYLKPIEENSFTDEGLYFNTALYGFAALGYWDYTLLKYDSVCLKDPGRRIAKLYRLISDSCPYKMKEHLLSYLLKSYAEKGFECYDSLLEDYNQICKDKRLIAEVNDVAQKEKERGRKMGEITFEKALASIIEDQTGKTCTIKEVLDKKKFTVIDCWASWCLPCLKEIPYTKTMEQKYGKEFNFVFLSFDRNKSDWDSKIKELKNTNNTYLLVNGFKSDLALHFGIASIPRYLIFDSNGNIVNTNASRPSKPQFEEILDKLITENKLASQAR